MSSPYWESRGARGYTYRGETFYTVTPIPYYYERRKILLSLMEPVIRESEAQSICDFGCGDGYYLSYFSRLFPSAHWTGIDISASMLEQARRACPDAAFCHSGTGIPPGMRFDLVYAIAVFAHVMDEALLASLLDSIREAIKPGGLFLLFEQTGPEQRGTSWCRRPTRRYLSRMSERGFEPTFRRLVAYPVHRMFENTVAAWYCRLFTRGADALERRLSANRSRVFRAMSRLALALDRKVLWADDGIRPGNTFYVFRKL